MHALRRDRQLCVDGRGKGVDEVRPARVVYPESGGAALAKIPLGAARLAMAVAFDLGAVDADRALALNP